jgi:hypothetical protein
MCKIILIVACLAITHGLPADYDASKYERPTPINPDVPGEPVSQELPRVTLLKDSYGVEITTEKAFEPTIKAHKKRDVQVPATTINNQQPGAVSNTATKQLSADSVPQSQIPQSNPAVGAPVTTPVDEKNNLNRATSPSPTSAPSKTTRSRRRRPNKTPVNNNTPSPVSSVKESGNPSSSSPSSKPIVNPSVPANTPTAVQPTSPIKTKRHAPSETTSTTSAPVEPSKPKRHVPKEEAHDVSDEDEVEVKQNPATTIVQPSVTPSRSQRQIKQSDVVQQNNQQDTTTSTPVEPAKPKRQVPQEEAHDASDADEVKAKQNPTTTSAPTKSSRNKRHAPNEQNPTTTTVQPSVTPSRSQRQVKQSDVVQKNNQQDTTTSAPVEPAKPKRHVPQEEAHVVSDADEVKARQNPTTTSAPIKSTRNKRHAPNEQEPTTTTVQPSVTPSRSQRQIKQSDVVQKNNQQDTTTSAPVESSKPKRETPQREAQVQQGENQPTTTTSQPTVNANKPKRQVPQVPNHESHSAEDDEYEEEDTKPKIKSPIPAHYPIQKRETVSRPPLPESADDDNVQGPLIHRPVPVDQILKRHSTEKPQQSDESDDADDENSSTSAPAKSAADEKSH